MNKSVISNVYLDKIAAKNFEKSAYIRKKDFYRVADYIVSVLERENIAGRKIDVLDVGCGTGRTILNILERFRQSGVQFDADCFDSSESMLRIFKNNIKKYKYLNDKNVTYIKHDANEGLGDFSLYDLIFFVSVLQYFTDWRSFLSDLLDHTKTPGYIVIAELIGWYELLDGTFESEDYRGKFDFQFWKKYFKIRKMYAAWEPEIKFSNVKPALNFLKKKCNLRIIEKQNFLWPNDISWKDVLLWIEKGPVSSLGSNLSKESRRALKNEMKEYLKNHDKRIREKFKIEWGFTTYILKKG
jgi:SAM-dependent methyltransferase